MIIFLALVLIILRKYGLENSHSHSVIYMPGGFHN